MRSDMSKEERDISAANLVTCGYDRALVAGAHGISLRTLSRIRKRFADLRASDDQFWREQEQMLKHHRAANAPVEIIQQSSALLPRRRKEDALSMGVQFGSVG